MNIPEARAKAADASFPTLVDDGRAFFKIRRMHARGGSNSTAEGKVAGGGGAVDVAAAVARVNVSDAASITGLLSFSSMSVAFCGVVMLVDALIFWLLLSMCCVDVVEFVTQRCKTFWYLTKLQYRTTIFIYTKQVCSRPDGAGRGYG